MAHPRGVRVSGFAVVDVETTGLYNADRIVEVGVVLLDADLCFEHEWVTLLNPHRHLGAGDIHGITATDVADAPDFPAVGSHLAALLDGRVVVAHNAPFDLRMLALECDRHSVHSPRKLVTVDTLRLSRAALGGTASLTVVAEYLSIDASPAHDALGDARITAQVLARLVDQADGYVQAGAAMRSFGIDTVAVVEPYDGWAVDQLAAKAAAVRWENCRLADPAPCHSRQVAVMSTRERETYLARLVAELPALPELADPRLDAYVLMLEQALADRLITTREAEDLAEVALQTGLSADMVMDAHAAFLRAVAVAAWADGIITPAEREDLDDVARMLGLHPSDVGRALTEAQTIDRALAAAPSGGRLSPGDRVVFTGAASMPRSVLEGEADAVGLIVTSSVSKKTRAVVMADPLSESTKARKARELGIDVMAEQVFLTACAQLRSSLTQL